MINKILLCVLFLLCATAPKAQNLPFDLSFINESTEAELFILDPNYNKDHQIEYYSFGDMMKVQYEYNDQHRPVKKVLYTMDQFNLEWEQTQMTTFTYNNDQLVEEKFIHFYKNKPVYIVSKTTTRHKNQNIDTIRRTIEWRDKALQNQMRIYIPEGYSVRYLNKHRQPDSILQITKSQSTIDRKPSCIKQYFTYNKKQQLIGGKAISRPYYKDDVPKKDQVWTDLYVFEIKHGKHKIEYMQITDVPMSDRKADANGDQDAPRSEKQIIEVTTYTDKHHRLLSKQLVYNKKQILKSIYHYDRNGQTNVTTELNLNPPFWSTYGFTSLSKLNILLGGLGQNMEAVKYVVSHTDSSRNSTFYIDNKLVKAIHSCYQPSGKLIFRERFRYNNDTLVNHKKDTYQYFPEGVEKIRFYGSSKGLKQYERYLYKKDSSDRIVYKEKFRYNEKNKWEPKGKSIYAYDQHGYLSLDEYYKYNVRSGKPSYYLGKYSTSWVKDSRNNILEAREKVWKNGMWRNSNMKKYAYNTNNDRTLIELYVWNKKSNAWEGEKRDTFYVNKSGNITGEINYSWMDGKWVFDYKKETETEYDKTGQHSQTQVYYFIEKKTSYKWIQNKWEPKSESVNKKGKFDSFSSESVWDAEKLAWRIKYEDKNWSRGDTSYIESTGVKQTVIINNKKGVRCLFKEWDLKYQTWKNTTAYNQIKINDTNSLISYEKYNETKRQWEFDRRMQMVNETNDKTSFTQSYWNGLGWVYDYRIILSFENNENETERKELYKYQTFNNVWLPLYCSVITGYVEKQYLKWNEKNKKWGNNLLQIRGSEHYQWSESLQKYIASNEKEKILAIEREFDKINLQNEDAYNKILFKKRKQPTIY